MASFINFIGKIADFLWGPWTMALIGLGGIYLTIISKGFQFRKFGLIMKSTIGGVFKKKEQDPDKEANGIVTTFQAVSTALAGCIGTGNVAGVATAISIGGPGAVFWMWVFALIGMCTKCVEVTLAVHYRELSDDGDINGGPMYYMRKGLGWEFLAKLFSFGIVINAFLAAGTLQPHTVGRTLLSAYNINPYITATVMAIITGFVVVGGVKSIGKFTEKLVPFMSVFYMIVTLIVVFLKFNAIPDVISMIFKYAFAPAPAIGGFIGSTMASALRSGMSRGILSNEAGLGTSTIVHAKAQVSHPIKQGMWGAFEVFFDTIVICSMTAFLILSTGVLGNGLSGAELTLSAFQVIYNPNLANLFMSITVLTFCLSTQIGFYVYYETSVKHLFGPKYIKVFKWLYLIPGVLFAGVSDVDALWKFADVATGTCVIPNMIAILALSGVYLKLQKDSESGENKYATIITDNNKNYVKTADVKLDDK